MSYHTLTVCLDDGLDSTARLRFALGLAVRHNAFLNGIHLSYMPSPSFAAYDGVDNLYESLLQDLARRQAAAGERFRAAAAGAGVPAAFVAARNLDMNPVTAFARASDLIIAGRPNLADTAAYIGEGFPSRFALEAGRPVLFLPEGTPPVSDFGHVMVAWNGSRESTRALFDALPLLQQAGRVTLLTVARGQSPWPGHGPVPAPDMEGLLRRHGIKPRVLVNTTHESPGEWLLERAADIEDPADLLVAGAYGHSRLAELVLGGVTRNLLDGMTLPVLLSH